MQNPDREKRNAMSEALRKAFAKPQPLGPQWDDILKRLDRLQ